jgi:RNA polymerase subunit RPABC4/transcription elongation factor Spt4
MPPNNVPIKYCRHCGRLIHLQAADCPYCGGNTIRRHEGRTCPFCKENIKPGAVKCKHCGEFVDGRSSRARPEGPPGPAQQVVIQIENAIIADTGQPGGPQLMRPDGQVVDVQRVPDRALPPGVESTEKRGAAGELPDGGRRALPGQVDEDAEPAASPPAVVDAEVVRSEQPQASTRPSAPVPARAADGPPAPAEPKERRRAEEPEQTPGDEEPPGGAPPVQYPCPGCKATVLEGDNFCENCGRDLSLHPDQPEFPEGRLSALADYALVCGLIAPVTAPLGLPWSLSLAALGIVLGIIAIARIRSSRGRLRGTVRSVGAVVISLFWLLAIAIFGG